MVPGQPESLLAARRPQRSAGRGRMLWGPSELLMMRPASDPVESKTPKTAFLGQLRRMSRISERLLPRSAFARGLSFSLKDAVEKRDLAYVEQQADVFGAERHEVGECLFHHDRAWGCNCERVKSPIMSASGAWHILGRRFKAMTAADKRAAASAARLTRTDAPPAEQERLPPLLVSSRMRDELLPRCSRCSVVSPRALLSSKACEQGVTHTVTLRCVTTRG